MRILEVKVFSPTKTETYHVTVGDNEKDSIALDQYFNGAKIKEIPRNNKFFDKIIERDVTDLYKDVGYKTTP